MSRRKSPAMDAWVGWIAPIFQLGYIAEVRIAKTKVHFDNRERCSTTGWNPRLLLPGWEATGILQVHHIILSSYLFAVIQSLQIYLLSKRKARTAG